MKDPGAAVVGSRAQASGHFDPAHEVLLRNQVHGTKDGNDILTPLVLSDGTAVIVDRGWMPTVGARTTPLQTVTNTGPVVVTGIVHTTSPLNAQDAVTKPGGQLALPRVDLSRIAQAVPDTLQPRWIGCRPRPPRRRRARRCSPNPRPPTR